jgi:phosphate-selective porin OprO and OprP
MKCAWAAAVAALAVVHGSPLRAEDSIRWGPGLKLAAPGSDFHIGLAGYVQGDGRSFRNWGNRDEADLRNETTELRRIRLGFEGEWKRLRFEFDVDPHDTGDRLKNAYLELSASKRLRLRAGHFKVPVSREFLTSAAKTDFIERTMLGDHVGPGRDWGVMLHGDATKSLTYQVGVFAGDGSASVNRAETTVVGRLVVSPLTGLEIGGSASRADVRADAEAGDVELQPRGIVGDSPSGFRFYSRHFVDGRRLRLGVDAAYLRGPVAFKAELLQGREKRKGQGSVFDDLPEEVATGWAVSGTWLVTGDKKRTTIRPKHPLFGGAGAVEVGVRYESLRFDDDGPDTGFEGAGNRARNIRPVADRVLTAGFSWWPITYVRFMGNVLVERYQDALLAPEPGRRGNYVTLLGRVQFQLP